MGIPVGSISSMKFTAGDRVKVRDREYKGTVVKADYEGILVIFDVAVPTSIEGELGIFENREAFVDEDMLELIEKGNVEWESLWDDAAKSEEDK